MPTTHSRHKRLSRKELRQPDEFQTFFEDARSFVHENQTRILVFAAGVLVAIAAVVGVLAYQRHKDRIAGDRFYAALSALNDKQYAEAETGFKRLARDDPGREAGRLAQFYLGICLLDQGHLSEARDAFTAYIAQSHDPVFTSLAAADLAVVYERMGDWKKAQDAYARAAEAPGPEQLRAQLGVARMMAKQGDKPGAIKTYQKFLKEHPFSVDNRAVTEALAQLGASPAPSVSPRILAAPAVAH